MTITEITDDVVRRACKVYADYVGPHIHCPVPRAMREALEAALAPSCKHCGKAKFEHVNRYESNERSDYWACPGYTFETAE